jgi:hypothetical protein
MTRFKKHRNTSSKITLHSIAPTSRFDQVDQVSQQVNKDRKPSKALQCIRHKKIFGHLFAQDPTTMFKSNLQQNIYPMVFSLYISPTNLDNYR